MNLSPTVLARFNRSRKISHVSTLCYAPELSLNFDQTGNITTCCFNRTHVLGRYPESNIQQAWTGPAIDELRDLLAQNDLSLGCHQCHKMLEEGNFESVLIKHFDDFVPLQKSRKSFFENLRKGFEQTEIIEMPVLFEFEISNTCNLECIMCGGHWSSKIRQNREHLPSLHNPYDQHFVEEIITFLPTLQRANFLGGEPFLIPIYFDIWKAIIAHNNKIEVAITSNGTILSNRVKEIVEGLKHCKITLSIDSLQKKTYESIRLNGNFNQVEETIAYLLKAKKLVSFSVCPMIQNWQEIPDIVAFCADNQLDIYFNIVFGPLGGRIKGIHENADQQSAIELQPASHIVPEASLQTLSKEELEKIIQYYRRYKFENRYQSRLNGLISQLEFWAKSKE